MFRQQTGQRYSETLLQFTALMKRPKREGACQRRPTVEAKTYPSLHPFM